MELRLTSGSSRYHWTFCEEYMPALYVIFTIQIWTQHVSISDNATLIYPCNLLIIRKIIVWHFLGRN